MSTEKKVLLAISGGVILVVIFLFSTEIVEKEIAPRLRTAWVAIEVEDSGIARTGPVEIDSGIPFRLHAVVEAETFRGETVYFTEAAGLEIEGSTIPVESLRVWSRPEEPRILWFTVDGYKPFMEISDVSQLEDFRFQDNFRADWPRSWSIPGSLRPRSERDQKSGLVESLPGFGTQRYHVRVEIFGPRSEITPEVRVQSLRATDLPGQSESFTTVQATLPGGLGLPSKVYGLSQIEPGAEAPSEVADRLAEWFGKDLAFSRLLVLRDILDQAGTTYGELVWNAVELGTDQTWGDGGVKGGDLLRVGDRWVVLLQDGALPNVLDRDDLCLDFDKGPRVRQIGEVFTGEGLVEWASLGFG